MNSQMQLDCQRRYREKHKDRVKASDAAYLQSHKVERAAYQKLYREANKEKCRAQRKAYYEAHKNDIRIRRSPAQKPTGFCWDCGDECEGLRCAKCQADREDIEQPARAPYVHIRHKFIFTGLDCDHDSDAESEWDWMRGQGIFQEFGTVKESAKKGFLGVGLLGVLEETGKVYRIFNGGIELHDCRVSDKIMGKE